PPLAAGQGFTATIRGTITDQSGGVLKAVTITVKNTNKGWERTTTTDDSGDYVVTQLPADTYSISAQLKGFKRELRDGVVLQTGQEARLDMSLSVGQVEETVTVVGGALMVQSENANLGNVVDEQKVKELPLNGRDYLQLAQLQPNVFAPAQNSTLGFRGGFNVAGNSEIANNYIKDGIDNNDETTNQPLHRPILDAVREFKVLTGTYSAEYGRQAGGQVIVSTKSGTNGYHGAAFEFHRNSPLDARNFFAPVKPSFRRNQFGGVFGGPIRHDRTFFFIGYEGQRRGQQEASLATVPTQAMKRGDFSAISTALKNPFDNNKPFPGNQIGQQFWSKQGAGLLALFPDPNRSASNNIASAGTGAFNLNQFSVRVDHKITDKDSLFAVYEFADSSEFFPLNNPLCSARDVSGWGCDELQRTQHASLVFTHVFGPRLVAEGRVGYTRFGFFRLQEDRNVDVINRLGIGGLTDAGRTPFNNGAPQLNVTGFVIIGGPTNLPQGRHDNTYHYVGNMTFVQGRHTMKWGTDIRRFLFNSFFTSFGRGSFRFDGRFTGNAVADLLLGMPSQADRNLGEPFHNAMTFSSGYYFQDDWKISPKLTLNLGLRYELNLPPVERVDKMASFDPNTNTIKVAGGREAFINPTTGLLEIRPRADVGRRMWETDKNNFAPRIGLAWRPFGGSGTVIRAGFGTFYNLQIVGNGITPLSRNSPFRQRQTAGPFAASARPSLVNAFSGNPSVVPPGIDPHFRTAYINEWSLGVQHEVFKNTVLDISYLGSEGHKLPLGPNINQALPPSADCIANPSRADCTVSARRPFKGFGNITGGFISSIGNSTFNSLQIRAERRMTRGLSLISSYTWSKSIDNGSGISTGSDSSGAEQNARDFRSERAVSDYDVAHRWVFSYVYDLPFGRGRHFATSNSVANAIVSGWQMTGILTLQTGRPFTVFTNTDQSATGQNADRPNIIGDWRVANPGPDRWFNPCTLLADGKTLRNCLPGDKPAWQVNAPGTFGNAGRNILRGDGLKNFDLGIYRSFRITERQSVQFRSEVFNLPNHPNFFFPNTSLSSSAFATISRAASASQIGAQRQIQFGLKYIF
ncbi:MAG TPA: carboxypeptidase-like regulatory domain-containing protein, partial [Blastocatellia bacterium]|nr:carboxypeptidase-like regulatory domain-containing protein [Blastocatellia bacterium]